MSTTHSHFPWTALIIVFLALVSLSLGGVWLWWKQAQNPVDSANKNNIQIVIPKGYGVIDIGSLLYEKKLIRDSFAFKLYAKQHNLGNKLQAGSYLLSPSQNLAQVTEALTKGTEDLWVTIPEGKRREEIAKILSDVFTKEGYEFSIPDFMAVTQDQEGYLFPDTYLIPKSMTATEVASLMRKTYDKKVSNDMKTQATKLGLTPEKAMILASLVEREAKFESDRPKIAQVMLNRIKTDMPLQIDASIQYAVGTATCRGSLGTDCNWWPKIQDTSYNSPYNTYTNSGLPPAPICNPGLSVIQAVLNPVAHDYLYYVSEDNGTTHYAKTLEEHEKNIHKYLE